MEVEDFVAARLAEVESCRSWIVGWSLVEPFVELTRDFIKLQEEWPVLIETEPNYEFALNEDDLRMSMVKQMEFITRREYVKRFGNNPPGAPLIRKLAMAWSHHSDFQEEWSI